MSGKALLAVLFGALIVSPALAQDAPPSDRGGDRGRDGGRDGGGRGNFDPAQFRERMEQRLKEQLGVNDEEWKVLQPKLTKVFEAQRGTRGGFGGFFGGRGGPDGGRGRGDDNNSQRTPVETAQRELSTTLENKDASAEQITAKLTALREAREKAKANLVAAQKELKEVLTQRQEATLVMMGMLD